MSTTYGTLPKKFMDYFDEQIHAVAWQQCKFLNWFMGFPGTQALNGPVSGRGNKIDGPMIKSIEEGLETFITWEWEKMEPGKISASLAEAPIQHPRITEKSIQLMTLSTRLAFSVNQIDAWRHNRYINAGDLIAQALRQVMLPLTNQVDQFICYGDNFLTPVASGDRIAAKGVGKFTGLFNGFSTFAAGLGSDNDVGDKGDIVATYIRGRHNLRTKGFDTGPYYILSDETTQTNSESGNLLYTTGTKVISEYSALMGQYKYKQGELADWIESINAFPGNDTDESRLCVTQPYITQQGRRMEPAYLLVMGYNFKVWPLWGGGLNGNAQYEFLIATSIALKSFNDYSLYRTSADLTFNGS